MNAKKGNDTGGGSGGATGGALNKTVMVVAIVVLIGFVLMLIRMYSQVGVEDDKIWGRMLYLYGGVEALAFAAAGYLFGKEVHRQQAENAEKRADEKTEEAADATAKGRSLSTAIASKIRANQSATSGYGSLGGASTAAMQSIATKDLEELDTLARSLFPT